MEQRKLTFLITHLILRIRDYPTDAVDELLAALDKIDRKYDLEEKLTPQEWEAVLESRHEITWVDRVAKGEIILKTSLTKEDREAAGKYHFDVAVKRVRMHDGEEQGDISDLLFALLDEYFLDLPDFK
jgi:hypothetical protein